MSLVYLGVIILDSEFMLCSSSNSWDIFLVPFLATRELVAPLQNDPIISGRLILMFRHLKHQNLSTDDDFIQSSGIIFFVPFLATKEVLAPLANDPIMLGRSIQSLRHLERQNPSIILDSMDWRRRVATEGGKKSRGHWLSRGQLVLLEFLIYIPKKFWKPIAALLARAEG